MIGPEQSYRSVAEQAGMGFARLSLYIVGLIVVVLAAWVFLTQTPISDNVPPGVSLAIILLLVGIGVMAGARAMDDTFSYRRRVSHDADRAPPGAPTRYTGETRYTGDTPYNAERTDTVIEERRF